MESVQPPTGTHLDVSATNGHAGLTILHPPSVRVRSSNRLVWISASPASISCRKPDMAYSWRSLCEMVPCVCIYEGQLGQFLEFALRLLGPKSYESRSPTWRALEVRFLKPVCVTQLSLWRELRMLFELLKCASRCEMFSWDAVRQL